MLVLEIMNKYTKSETLKNHILIKKLKIDLMPLEVYHLVLSNARLLQFPFSIGDGLGLQQAVVSWKKKKKKKRFTNY